MIFKVLYDLVLFPSVISPFLSPQCSFYSSFILAAVPTCKTHSCVRAFVSAVSSIWDTLLFEIAQSVPFKCFLKMSPVQWNPPFITLFKNLQHPLPLPIPDFSSTSFLTFYLTRLPQMQAPYGREFLKIFVSCVYPQTLEQYLII